MTTTAANPLELRNVSGTSADGAAVMGITTAFSAGRLHILRGTGDSGKSALFRFAGLLEPPAEGEVLIFGEGTQALDEDARTGLRMQRIGFAFAAPFLLSSFSVIENVAMPLFKISQVDPDEARRRTQEVLEFVGLAHAVEAKVEDLATLAQYGVAIARGLVNAPIALLVEEVDGVLAGPEVEDFVSLLRRVATTFGVAIVATASPEMKTLASDRVLDIAHGVIARDSECLPEICE
ncbi:MAG TPA: ATP-binding cassette domain-containing protein [Chthoniobacter sp.]|nr:ATP-binding cassette domain-containing protein [Chthoniobacter sp.]